MSSVGVFYGGQLQQTFNTLRQAKDYINEQLEDCNAEKRKFVVKKDYADKEVQKWKNG